MKKHILPIALLACLLSLLACGNDSVQLKPLDLISHGLPISIMAPDSAEVKKSFSSIINELTITGQGNYGLIIQQSDAFESDPKKIKAERLKEKETSSLFSKIVLDEEQGFIYETKAGKEVSHQIYHVRVQGDKEYAFTLPYLGTYTLEEAQRVYDSVKGE